MITIIKRYGDLFPPSAVRNFAKRNFVSLMIRFRNIANKKVVYMASLELLPQVQILILPLDKVLEGYK